MRKLKSSRDEKKISQNLTGCEKIIKPEARLMKNCEWHVQKKRVELMIAHRGWWLVWSLNKASRWRYEWRWRSWRGVEASTPIKSLWLKWEKPSHLFSLSVISHFLLTLIFPWLNMFTHCFHLQITAQNIKIKKDILTLFLGSKHQKMTHLSNMLLFLVR